MNLLYQAPQEVRFVVLEWLVPLFILYSTVGWVGLPGREAERSQTLPTTEESIALRKSIWAAWWLGVLLSLAGITAGDRFLGSCPKSQNIAGWGILIAGLIGGLLGIARGIIPRLKGFRNSPPLTRRRIIAFLVACAVAVSISCGVFYYNSCQLVHGFIASFYAIMLIGYAATSVFEVRK